MKHLLLSLSFVLLIGMKAHSLTTTWISNAEDVWSNPSAWDNGVPGTNDNVVFSSAHSGDCIIDGDYDIGTGNITINGYVGVIKYNDFFSLSFGSFSQNSGTFDGDGSVSGFQQGLDLTLLGSFSLSGTANFIAPSGYITLVGGNGISVPSGSPTFTANTGTITFDMGAAKTIQGGFTYNNVEISTSQSSGTARNFTVSSPITINGSFTMSATSSRGVNIMTSMINLKGNFTASSYTPTNFGTSQSGGINFVGSSSQNFDGPTSGGQFPSININQTGTGGLNITGVINVVGNWSYNSSGTGSVNAGTSTITLSGSRTLDGESTGGVRMPFYNLNIGGTNTKVTLAGAIRVDGALNIPASDSLVTAGNLLELRGNFTNGNVFTPSTSRILLSGTNAQSLDFRSTTAMTLTTLTCSKTSNTATLTDAISISDSISCTGGTLDLNGNVTILSTASKTAQIGRSSGTITGNAIVQRYIAGGARKWVFLASPVTTSFGISNNWQQQIYITGSGTGGTNCPSLTSHTNGFDAATSNPASFYVYSESGKAWTSIAGTTSVNLATKTGYRVFVRGARSQGCTELTAPFATPSAVTLSATGTLATGTQVASLTCSNGCDNSNGDGWNLVGNPYAATVDMTAVTFTSVSGTIYGFNPSGNAYANYNVNTGVGDATARYMSSGQSFWVQATSASGAQLAFTENSKSTSQTGSNYFSKATSGTPSITITMADGADISDKTYIAFISDATRLYDGLYDGYKMGYTQGTISTYTDNINKKYAINTVPMINNGSRDTVYLDANLATGAAAYTLNFAFVNIPTGMAVYLIDRYTASQTLISNQQTYSFSTDNNTASVGAGRFAIVFTDASSLPVKLTQLSAQKESDHSALVKWTTAQEINNNRFEVERSLDSRSFEKIGEVTGKGNSSAVQQYSFTDVQPNTNAINYYRLKQIDNDGTSEYSQTVSVTFSNGKAAVAAGTELKMFPIPAKDVLNVSANRLNGKVTISIYDITGALIRESETSADMAGNINYTLDLNKLRNGTYIIELNNNGSAVSRSKFIKE